MNEPIQVLDHGYVKYVAHLGTDESIIDAARMSTNGGFVSWEPYEGHPKGDAGLLAYLYKHQHMTPFEMADLVIEVQAPIFVVREWMRSRTQSYNEASARYAVMPDLHYLPPMDRMVKQDQKNKQAGAAELMEEELSRGAIRLIEEDQVYLYQDYLALLDGGLAREVARINTPVSRYTRFRAKANLRNWLQFLHLRLAENAQLEIRVYAEAVASIVKHLWPRTWELFEEYTRYGKHLSRTEAEQYRQVMQGRHNHQHQVQKLQGDVADLQAELVKHREACERLLRWFKNGEIPPDAASDRDFAAWVLS